MPCLLPWAMDHVFIFVLSCVRLSSVVMVYGSDGSVRSKPSNHSKRSAEAFSQQTRVGKTQFNTARVSNGGMTLEFR